MKRRQPSHKTPNLPSLNLRNIQSLSLIDLNRLRNSLVRYRGKFQERLTEIERIDVKNEEIRNRNKRNQKENERFENEVKTKKINPLKKQIEKTLSQLKENEIHLITGIFTGQETAVIGGYRVPSSQEGWLRYDYDKIPALKKELTHYQKKIDDTADRYYKSIKKEFAVPTAVKNSTKLSFLGTKYEVNFDKFKIEDIEKRIARKTVTENRQRREHKETLDNLKARAAENEAERRSQAKSLRQDFQSQKRISQKCPYCGTYLNKSEAHNDHIYPVAKGGQSSRENMVFVCSKCNLKKGKLTLHSFIEKFQYDREQIYSRLRKLDKEF
jgi:5-methylcytosine-specific restriction endonuclease McrA